MRNRFNAPIEYDREANGYHFGRPRTGPRYELPGLWFNAGEAYALLSMHTLLAELQPGLLEPQDRKSTRLNSRHRTISYAVFCLKKKTARRQIAREEHARVRHGSGPWNPYRR